MKFIILKILLLFISNNLIASISSICDIKVYEHDFRYRDRIYLELLKFKDSSCRDISFSTSNLSQESMNKILDSLNPKKNKDLQLYLFKIRNMYIQNSTLDSLPGISMLEDLWNKNYFEFTAPCIERITFHNCEIGKIYGLGLKQIIDLDVNNSFYLGFPKGIEDMKNLINLSISWENEVLYKEKFPNEFIDLDISLRRFTKGDNLTSLHILYHQFDTIPDYIMYLTNIRYLKIEGKKLITLPQYLENHKNLYYIDISDWGLVELPDWIFSSKKKYLLELNKEQKEKNWDKIQQSTNLTIKYYSRVIKRAD